MHTHRLRFLFALLLILQTAAISVEVNAKEPSPGFISMFNGKDLSDWEGPPGWWQVQDGVLFAESTSEKPCLKTHYLYWKGGEPKNFEIRATYRITGEANSGIQFRSEKRPNWDTLGYQADIDSAGSYTGCLYHNERGLVTQRGQKVHIDTTGNKDIATNDDTDKLLNAINKEGWNEYRILAHDNNVTLWINNTQMCHVEDHDERYPATNGIIALQLHQGPPMKVEFKNLEIRIIE